MQPPQELETGILMDRFKQTPGQLGFAEVNDHAFLFRCIEATELYRIAKKRQVDFKSLSSEEVGILLNAKKETKKKRRKKSKVGH